MPSLSWISESLLTWRKLVGIGDDCSDTVFLAYFQGVQSEKLRTNQPTGILFCLARNKRVIVTDHRIGFSVSSNRVSDRLANIIVVSWRVSVSTKSQFSSTWYLPSSRAGSSKNVFQNAIIRYVFSSSFFGAHATLLLNMGFWKEYNAFPRL